MIVNAATVGAIVQELNKVFFEQFQTEIKKTTWQRIAMRVPSTSSHIDYKWLSDFPGWRKWVGSKVINFLKANKYVLANDDWESSFGIRRNDIEDGQLGGYETQIIARAKLAAQFPEKLVYQALNDGFTKTCWDGQYFFDTDHQGFDSEGRETIYSNKFTQQLQVDSFASAQATYGAMRTAMMAQYDKSGDSLEINPRLLVVPPQLEDKAKFLMTADKFPDNTPNIYKGTAEILTSARIKSPTAWFLLDAEQAVKPLIFQDRKPPTPVTQVSPDADPVFNNGEYIYSLEARAAAGHGFPQTAFGSTGTL